MYISRPCTHWLSPRKNTCTGIWKVPSESVQRFALFHDSLRTVEDDEEDEDKEDEGEDEEEEGAACSSNLKATRDWRYSAGKLRPLVKPQQGVLLLIVLHSLARSVFLRFYTHDPHRLFLCLSNLQDTSVQAQSNFTHIRA